MKYKTIGAFKNVPFVRLLRCYQSYINGFPRRY